MTLVLKGVDKFDSVINIISTGSINELDVPGF
jgi:hypothetical protein